MSNFLSLRHLGIVTSKINESVTFYEDLGFRVYWDKEETGSFINDILNQDIEFLRTVKMKNQYFCIELLDFEKQSEINNVKITDQCLTHFAVDVKNIKEIYRKYENFFLNEPQENEDGKFLVAFMKDPNNELYIELVEKIK